MIKLTRKSLKSLYPSYMTWMQQKRAAFHFKVHFLAIHSV